MPRPAYHPNLFKFRVPPTIEMIDEAIRQSGLKNDQQFEALYGLYNRCLKHARSGYRDIPIHYWHLFYEPGQHLPPKQKARKPKEIKKPKTKIQAHPQLAQLIS